MRKNINGKKGFKPRSGRLLAVFVAGLLAIAAYAAGGSGQGAPVIDQNSPNSRAVRVVIDAEGDQAAAQGSQAAVAPAGTPGSGVSTLDAVRNAGRMVPLAAPSNDDCTGAIVIPDGPFPVLTAPVDTADAAQVDEAGMCGPADGTIWYTFTPSASGAYIFTTCPAAGATGSTLADSVIAVFESTGGGCPAAAQLACNDTAPPSCGTAGFDGATAQATLTAGTTYFVVAGKWSPQGPVTAPDSTIVIEVEKSAAPANDTCGGAIPLTFERVVRGTTVEAGNDYQSESTAACFPGVGQVPSTSPGRDVVYTFTAPADGSYNIRYIQDEPSPALRGQNPTLYASSTCPAGGGQVSCLLGANREQPASGLNKAEEIWCLPMTAGQSIFVFFDDHAAGNAGGVHDIEVSRCVNETEPNNDPASANAYTTCAGFTTGEIVPGGAAGDIDFFSLGSPAAGSKIFAAIDAPQVWNTDFAMRVTTATDTLQFDDNDGTSVTGSNAPVITGVPATGDPTYLRIGHNNAAGAGPYHLYARVVSGAPQLETEPNNPAPNSLSRALATPITGGGYIRGESGALTDVDCFRFIANEGDDLAMFSVANPDRVAGSIVDVWPIFFDLAPSGYNLFRFGGQIVRNDTTPSPGTLVGTTPTITSEFWAHRARYSGTHVICWMPIQATAGATFPLPYEGLVTANCNPLPAPADRNADISVTKTGPAGPVQTSAIVEYTIEITNNGPDFAQDVRLVDVLPPEVTLQGVLVNDGFGAANVTCAPLGATIDCTNWSIAPGATTTWTIVVQVNGCIGSGVLIDNTVDVTTLSTDPDMINNTSTWEFETVDDGSCTDNDACTSGDRCEAGACIVDGPTDCNDDNPCTDDFCDSATGCVYDPGPGQQCDDGFDCTLNLCDPDLGIPGIGCYFPPAEAGTPCNDFFPCTGPDACDGVTPFCSGPPVSCDDGNSCTADSCDPGTGDCIHTQLPAGSACDDGDACSTGETCDAGGVCQPGGGTVTCDDGSVCTTDSCDPASGCVYTPIVCDDGNACTDDSCDPAAGCVYTDNTAACDDGNGCTTNDSCSGGVCVGRDPVVCTSIGQCYDAGVCDPATGLCSNPPSADGTPCDDSNTCTTNDTCQAGSCVGDNSGYNEPNPRTNGYYKRLCHGPHSGDELTAADAACVAGIAPATFGWVSSVADICSVIQPGSPNSDKCQQSEDDLLVLALNICKARVCPTQGLDSQCGSNTSVAQSLAEADAIFSDPSRNFQTCQHGKCITEEINTGRSLLMNSLRLAKASGGGLTLSWTQPYVNDGETIGAYKVWRRVHGNGAFVKIATVNSLTFTDPTSGDFDYEVTAVKQN